VLFGLLPVLLALKWNRRNFYTLFIKESLLSSTKPSVQEIIHLANLKNIVIEPCSVQTLYQLSQDRPHQGVCMDTSLLQYEEMDMRHLTRTSASENSPPIWLVLNEIQDPMNFGAILRTSHFLGITTIITTEKNSCALSPVVSKASCGVLEVQPVYTVADIESFLQNCKLHNWRVLGTTGVSPSGGIDKYKGRTRSINEIETNGKCILVLGNEGKGLSPNVKEICDYLITVPAAAGVTKELDSLNVSVATGIVLYQLMLKKTK